MLAKEIIIETLRQIQRDRVTATPEVYAKTFCAVAKKAGLDLAECKPAKPHIARLPEQLRAQAEARNICTLEELMAFLVGALQRGIGLSKKETEQVISELTKLLGKAMTPSFGELATRKLTQTLAALERNPLLAIDKKYQARVIALVGERIRFDRARISHEANELKKSVISLYDVVSTMRGAVQSRSENLGNFSLKLERITPENSSKELFKELKNTLCEIASELGSDVEQFGKQLDSSKMEITSLKAQISAMHEEMERLVKENMEDYLTRVQTKKMIDLKLAELDETRADFAVLFFDIDFFKKINDTYGHEAGDKILQALGELLKSLLASSCLVGRYGGEEFVALLTSTRLADAAALAEKVRLEVEKSRFAYRDQVINMTISCGVSVRSEADGIEGVMRQADARLYAAKQAGRNRVVSKD